MMAERKCPACGATVRERQVFCRICGEPLDREAAMAETIERAFQGLVYAGCCDGQPGHAADIENRMDKARAFGLACLDEGIALWLEGEPLTRGVYEDDKLLELRERIEALG